MREKTYHSVGNNRWRGGEGGGGSEGWRGGRDHTKIPNSRGEEALTAARVEAEGGQGVYHIFREPLNKTNQNRMQRKPKENKHSQKLLYSYNMILLSGGILHTAIRSHPRCTALGPRRSRPGSTRVSLPSYIRGRHPEKRNKRSQ